MGHEGDVLKEGQAVQASSGPGMRAWDEGLGEEGRLLGSRVLLRRAPTGNRERSPGQGEEGWAEEGAKEGGGGRGGGGRVKHIGTG